jgi:hypothetical protein
MVQSSLAFGITRSADDRLISSCPIRFIPRLDPIVVKMVNPDAKQRFSS